MKSQRTKNVPTLIRKFARLMIKGGLLDVMRKSVPRDFTEKYVTNSSMEIVVENPKNADSTTPPIFGGPTAGPKRRRRRKVVTNRNG